MACVILVQGDRQARLMLGLSQNKVELGFVIHTLTLALRQRKREEEREAQAGAEFL